MPEENYVWLPKKDLLKFEEIARLVDIFTTTGVHKVRLTGGEPLLRKNVVALVGMLSENPLVDDLALTTNGLLLAEHAQSLFDAGLDRVTVSLDTLRPDRYQALTRSNGIEKVFRGIKAAREAGFRELKIDSVILRGTNEDEIVDLVEFGKDIGAEVRFIEYMDVGGATQWSMDRVFPKAQILETLKNHYGTVEPMDETRWAPANRFRLDDRTVLGVISSITDPFCRTCDRSRLTADGLWYLCLYTEKGIDLRQLLRNQVPRKDIQSLICTHWKAREDRGAEIRSELTDRSTLVEAEELRRNPHREMHTRGG
jgi:cyclic pyranopterin phosphate synthase